MPPAGLVCAMAVPAAEAAPIIKAVLVSAVMGQWVDVSVSNQQLSAQ